MEITRPVGLGSSSDTRGVLSESVSLRERSGCLLGAPGSRWSQAERPSQLSVSSSGSGNVAAATLLRPSWDPLTAS